MTFKEAALSVFDTGKYNCAESVLWGADKVLGLGLKKEDVALLGAYGGGCGCGSLCGAVAAGVAVIGRMNIEDRARTSDATKKAAIFVEQVKKDLGSEMCAPLMKAYRTEEAGCRLTIEKVADILDQVWDQVRPGE